MNEPTTLLLFLHLLSHATAIAWGIGLTVWLVGQAVVWNGALWCWLTARRGTPGE